MYPPFQTIKLPHLILVAMILGTIPSAHAEFSIERIQSLVGDKKYKEALNILFPVAQKGNADAEELIGVMYAMGLGVQRDDQRAFEWYLRSSLKGHAGAQSGIGWYYEIGRGLTSPDLVRAHTWYVLSAIGGDPDAAMSQDEVAKKMTEEQLRQSSKLIQDYKAWLYPDK